MRRIASLNLVMLWLVTGLGGACLGGQPRPKAGSNVAAPGRALFLMNCAHCHGADATGDEGPDLHNLDLPDNRVARLINNGKKGEMPKFSTKLDAAQVRSLIAYLHTLK